MLKIGRKYACIFLIFAPIVVSNIFGRKKIGLNKVDLNLDLTSTQEIFNCFTFKYFVYRKGYL